MSHEEWLKVYGYLAAGSGKTLSKEAMHVYFDLLGDLSYAVMRIAAKRVLIGHPWPSFPSIAELRAAATATFQGQVAEISSGEAWGLAWNAIGKIDPEQQGSTERGLAGLPPLVVKAVEAMGIVSLCCSKDPVSVLRSQFVRTFEAIAARRQRRALLPANTIKEIERHVESSAVTRFPQVAKIGSMSK